MHTSQCEDETSNRIRRHSLSLWPLSFVYITAYGLVRCVNMIWKNMMDSRVTEFFKERKAAWLKKAITTSMTELEVDDKERECERLFSLGHWLPNAAKRAGQISLSTHPCTFSHPSAHKNKNGCTSSIIASSKRANDGYLRSGNVAVEMDALGNAAALDVYKFLMLTMEDGQTLLSHLQQNSDLAQKLFNIETDSYETLKNGFLSMTHSGADSRTSSKIKQVYFPVDNEYHQLSILSASGIMFELKKRIDAIRFSEAAKTGQQCKTDNKFFGSAYKQLVNLTTIGYGGTNPQNISVLNNENGGKVHLLRSVPPRLSKRDIHFPTRDFFTQSINYFQCRDVFYALHDLFCYGKNNWHIRHARDEYYQTIIDRIIKKMWLVRSVSKAQYSPDRNQLISPQDIWLCHINADKREEETDWLDDLCEDIAHFIFNGYEKILGKRAFTCSDTEFQHMHDQVVKNKEVLK